ncbi:DUF4365 domain-containing protein [Collimonas arenae]|uniref:DUF4365 domain-containing protein n=1 Tax=Collimonas arenae TaxID=279058 RepID=UPI0009DE781B|nr:DUF4365 domain-containing protein [Collimonas arenae]
MKSMLPIQTIEELISTSYVSAIIANAGHVPNTISHDFGVDLEVRRIGKHDSKRIDLGVILELQLKASVKWIAEAEHIVFDLEADAYNRLVFRRDNATTPCVLILCCLPRDQTQWLKVCEDELVIKKCCYYFFVDGPATTNSSSLRIRIPRSQLLTCQSITDMKHKIYGETLQ